MSSKVVASRSPTHTRHHQAVIEQELTRVRGRIRLLDVLSVALTVVAALMAYALCVVVLDHFFRLSEPFRQFLLIAFLVALAAYAVRALLPPLTRPVNPYYAARALEKSLPDTRNALVTWLDLHEKPLPPVVQEAVHKQALQELQGARVEEAVPSRWPVRLVMASLILLGLLLGLRFVWPDQYGSLLQRAFLPFTPKAVPTFTRIQLKLPVEDAIVESPETAPTLPIKVEHRRPVTIAVAVEGRIPDTVWIEYTSSLIPTPVKRTLAPPDKDQGRDYWTIILQEQDIPNDGLTFRIRGGDGMTRLYQLVVEKSRPEVEDLDLVLEYPAYLKRPPSRQNYGRLRAPEGTAVTLTVTADQPVKHGFLEIRVKDATIQTLDLEPDTRTPADDPRRPRRLSLTAPWVLSRKLRPQDPAAVCTYRLQMVSVEGKVGWSVEYPLEVIEDTAPWAVIKQVGSQIIEPNVETIPLPLNDVAPIRGMTGDDHAVREVRMRLRTVPSPDRPARDLTAFGGKAVDSGSEGKGLQQPRPFAQPPEEFQLVLDLGKLTDNPQAREPQPFPLKVGDRLELWVEPVDYREPEPNVGRSKSVIIELTEPLDQQQREEKQQQAQDQQQQFDQQRKQDQERREQQQPKDNRSEPQQGEQQQDRNQPQDQQQPKDGQQPKDNQQQPMPKDGQQQQPMPGEQKEPMPKDGQQQQQQPKDGQQPMPKDGQQPKDNQQQPMPKDGQQPKDNQQQPMPKDGQQAQQRPMPGEQKEPMPKDGQQPKDNQQRPMPGEQKDPMPKDGQQQQQQPKDGQQPKDNQQQPMPKDGQQAQQQPMPGEQKEPMPKDGQQQQQQPKDGQQPKDNQQQPMPKDGQQQQPMQGEQKEPMPKDGQQQQQPKDGQQPKDNQQQPMPGEQKDPMPKDGQQQQPKNGQQPKDNQQQPMPKDGQQAQQQPMPGEQKEPMPKDGQQQQQEQREMTPEQRREAEETARKAEELAEALRRSGMPDANNPDRRPANPKDPDWKPDPTNPEHLAKATDLMLESFKEKLERGEIDKDVLKQMKWSDADARRFLEQYQRLKKEGLLDQVRGVGPGKTTGVGRSATEVRSQRDLNVDPGLLPPPQLRSAWENLTRKRAAPPK